MTKYSELIKKPASDRDIRLDLEKDILSLPAFIRTYATTYAKEIEWATRLEQGVTIDENLTEPEKKRKLLKYFTLRMLQQYCTHLQKQGVSPEECQVTIIGRAHGDGLPFGDVDHLSRIQLVHVHGGAASLMLDPGSASGNKARVKPTKMMSENEIAAAMHELQDSINMSRSAAAAAAAAADSAADSAAAAAARTQLANLSSLTNSRTVGNQDRVIRSISRLTEGPEELDLSTHPDTGLGITPVLMTCILCVRLAGDTYLELSFENGSLKHVRALTEDEYNSQPFLEQANDHIDTTPNVSADLPLTVLASTVVRGPRTIFSMPQKNQGGGEEYDEPNRDFPTPKI